MASLDMYLQTQSGQEKQLEEAGEGKGGNLFLQYAFTMAAYILSPSISKFIV